jgi:hypothetical protein
MQNSGLPPVVAIHHLTAVGWAYRTFLSIDSLHSVNYIPLASTPPNPPRRLSKRKKNHHRDTCGPATHSSLSPDIPIVTTSRMSTGPSSTALAPRRVQWTPPAGRRQPNLRRVGPTPPLRGCREHRLVARPCTCARWPAGAEPRQQFCPGRRRRGGWDAAHPLLLFFQLFVTTSFRSRGYFLLRVPRFAPFFFVCIMRWVLWSGMGV